jgi:uncharacterized membrane protein YGL010W
MTDALRKHFADYAAFHTTAGNKACHSFGIPIIALASFALLARVPLVALGGFELTLAEVAIALIVGYYLTLDATGRFIAPLPAVGLFVVGWILQGVGHWVYEKNSPAFFRNFVHLAVGPLWILAKAIGRA